jgi:hypothetical protein
MWQRLSRSPQGRVRYALKTPWRNGTTHVEFEPIDFIAKLAALVPPPRTQLIHFHGFFAPNANLHAQSAALALRFYALLMNEFAKVRYRGIAK